ncbi:MAG: iron-containing alcohol dehydrogenase [Alphaproteobacteria bacterium]
MIQGDFTYIKTDKVIYGKPAAETLAAEAARLGAERVFLLASGTLARETDEIDKVKAALGARYAGLADHLPAHTPRAAVLDASAKARAANADLIVSFGGGSATDGAKLMQLCLAHDITEHDQFDDFRIITRSDGSTQRPDYAGPTVRQIAIPTTLSAGEFNPLAGCTDERRKMKEVYSHPLLAPQSIILDPAPTVRTPMWLWLSSGVRAVDHAVETLCSLGSNPYCDGTAMQALRLLSQGLPRVKADGNDLEARLMCQLGAWLSMVIVQGAVPLGASHGIGHVLGGTCDVPHGHTSCVMLPAVLRWNVSINGERQKLVAEAFGQPGAAAGEVVGSFIAGLGMPRTLADVGVGEDQYELIARNSMHDPWVHSNPRPIEGPAQVMEILRLAA